MPRPLQRVESEPLLVARKGRSMAPPAGGGGGGCCGSRAALTYIAVSAAADEAVAALVAELSQAAPARDDRRTSEPLARTWIAVFGPASTPPPIPSPRWKDLGFQGTDPVTDLRAARLAGLLYLCRLVERESAAAALGRAAAAGELPLGIASMNVLYMLRCHLALLPELPAYCPCCGTAVRTEVTTAAGQPHGGRHLRGFALLLVDDPDALYHIYATGVLLCGQLWAARFGGRAAELSRQAAPAATSVTNPVAGALPGGEQGDARLMEWPSILAQARRQVLAELGRLPPDAATLRRRLIGD